MKNKGDGWDVPKHIYMKGKDGQGIFYRTADCVFFITLLSTLVRKMPVQVLGFCLMFNHIHILARFRDGGGQVQFLSALIRSFAIAYNEEYKRTGPLFLHSYGQAPKQTAKKVRSCIAYINNNPVVGKQVAHAADYRWNLCAYRCSNHPYSRAIRLNSTRYPVRKAVAYIDYLYSTGQAVTYGAMRQMISGTTSDERRSLIDRILFQYNCLDYSSWDRLFGSYENALKAMEVNTGTEYDLMEDWEDYSVYRDMLQIARSSVLTHRRGIDSLTGEEIAYLVFRFQRELHAKEKQIRKFLHLTV